MKMRSVSGADGALSRRETKVSIMAGVKIQNQQLATIPKCFHWLARGKLYLF